MTPTLTKDRQTLVTDTSSKTNPAFKTFQLFSSTVLFAYKPSPMTQPITLDDTGKFLTPIIDDQPWDVEGTERITNIADQDVKLPLTQKTDNLTPTYSTTDDDDIDSLAEPRVPLDTRIHSYPGYKDFGAWLESQYPTQYNLAQYSFYNSLIYSQKMTLTDG